MNIACIVLRNCKESLRSLDLSVADEFLAGGFVMEETRFLTQFHDVPLQKTIDEFFERYEAIVLLAEKNLLLALAKLCGQGRNGEFFQATALGAGMYSLSNKTLFLLSLDNSESGLAYAKTACIPYLQKKYAVRQEKTVLRAIGANDEHVRNLLEDAKRLCDNKIQFSRQRKYDEDILEISYGGEVSKILLDDVMRLLVSGLGDNVYALDQTPIEERLVQLLSLRGYKISVAESFTGGGVGNRIVSVSGASKVYFEGVNVYNERAKEKRLGVSEYTLRTYGAASERTAYEMATGLLKTGDCDICIATTGVAGPLSDRTETPVGVCFLAVGDRERVYVYRYKFDGSREEITQKAINYALYLAYNHLKKI